jgi:hypothetical protein
MKDMRANGDIRINVQYAMYRFLGMADMMTDGFIAPSDGAFSELGQQDHWDLT